jgi:hypothetical protein
MGAARDLAIDLDTRELLVANGDLVLVRDGDSIRQDLDVRLRFFAGEWFLDETAGIPYFERVLVKSPDPEQVRSVFRDAILDTEGIAALRQLDLSFDRRARALAIAWSADTDLGELRGTTSTPVA